MRSVHLENPQHAVMNDRYTRKNCLIVREKFRMILTRVDTSAGYSDTDEFTRSPSYYIAKFNPEVYSEYLISSTRGFYQFGYTSRERLILDRTSAQLGDPSIVFYAL